MLKVLPCGRGRCFHFCSCALQQAKNSSFIWCTCNRLDLRLWSSLMSSFSLPAHIFANSSGRIERAGSSVTKRTGIKWILSFRCVRVNKCEADGCGVGSVSWLWACGDTATWRRHRRRRRRWRELKYLHVTYWLTEQTVKLTRFQMLKYIYPACTSYLFHLLSSLLAVKS